MLEDHPEVVKNILKEHGIEVEITDEEVDEHISTLEFKFIEEISGKIDSLDYFDRKEKFTTIIVNSRLPEDIHKYFYHMKECYLLNQFIAVIGLARVIMEIAFKDKYQKSGLYKSKGNVINIEDYSIRNIIREVCFDLKLGNNLRNEAIKNYDIFSDILHGKKSTIKMNSEDVLDFIKSVFNIIEKLYLK